MSYWATIDPAKTSGVAVWDGAQLVYAYATTIQTPIQVNYLLIEFPEYYQGESPSIANGLIKVGRVIGIWEALNPQSRIEHVTPKQWKRQLPKKPHHNRILRELKEPELLAMQTPKSEKAKGDMLDAIGLGLWKIGRLRV